MSVKKHALVFKERSVDWPPEIVKMWGGEILVLPDGRRAVRWPIINVDKVGEIPSVCHCPMGCRSQCSRRWMSDLAATSNSSVTWAMGALTAS